MVFLVTELSLLTLINLNDLAISLILNLQLQLSKVNCFQMKKQINSNQIELTVRTCANLKEIPPFKPSKIKLKEFF